MGAAFSVIAGKRWKSYLVYKVNGHAKLVGNRHRGLVMPRRLMTVDLAMGRRSREVNHHRR